jgi:AsmA protein
MKPLKIAALGFAGLLAVGALALAFGVPVGFVAKLAQDQVASHSSYRLRVDGATTLALRPSPTVTLGKINLVDTADSATSITADSVKVSLSLASLVSGRPEVTEVTVVKPAVRSALMRQAGNRRGNPARQGGDGAPAAATPAFTLGRLIVEEGSVVLSNARDRFESRIEHINLTGSLTAQEGRLDVRAVVDDQPIRLQVDAKTPLEGFNGRSIPVELSFEAPGMLDDTVTATADIRSGTSVFMINGLAGKIGQSKLNGWASVDFSSKPLVKADFDVQRLGVGVSHTGSNRGVASAPGTGRAKPHASEPWKSEDLRLVGLNYVDADVQFSAAELNVGAVRVAPMAFHATLADGVLNAAMLHNGLYGGEVDVTASVDVSGAAPKHTFRVDLAGVRALPLLSDAADFGSLDGQLRAKIDVRASGTSEREVMSSLSGMADMRVQDGQILGLNVPKMIRTLTSRVLTGWEESRTESTDLSDLSVSFQIDGGRATTSNLRLVGPLVRVSGSGTVDLGTQTLQFKLDPKLVASLEGQGGAADPLGFGVPVNIEGSWSDPRIYPDVAGILSDPDGAYAKLHALGQGLFGKDQGGGLDTLMQGLGTILGPKNEGRRNDDRKNDGRNNRNPPTGTTPSDRPSSNAPLGDFLRDLFGR